MNKQAMREESQEKGRRYQVAAKTWLTSRPLFRYNPAEFADAYDITHGATGIGGEEFDFALRLLDSSRATREILHVECKYRSPGTANVTLAFDAFLKRVVAALRSANTGGELEHHRFAFVGTLGPDMHRDFFNDPVRYYCSKIHSRNATDQDYAALEHSLRRCTCLILPLEMIEGH